MTRWSGNLSKTTVPKYSGCVNLLVLSIGTSHLVAHTHMHTRKDDRIQ